MIAVRKRSQGTSTAHRRARKLSYMESERTADFDALLRLGSLVDRTWDVTLEQALLITADVLRIDRVSYWRFR